MKEGKPIATVLILMALLSCSIGAKKKIVEYRDGKQIPIIDSSATKIGFIAPDSAEIGKEYCAKLWMNTKEVTLIKSFAICNFEISLVDTLNQTLDNCDSLQLLIENDTTYFCFKPLDIRDHNFKLGLLTVDKNNIFSLNTLKVKFKSFRKPSLRE